MMLHDLLYLYINREKTRFHYLIIYHDMSDVCSLHLLTLLLLITPLSLFLSFEYFLLIFSNHLSQLINLPSTLIFTYFCHCAFATTVFVLLSTNESSSYLQNCATVILVEALIKIIDKGEIVQSSTILTEPVPHTTAPTR